MAALCEGRIAIVTGAGRGIGREHALMLASHGAKVVVNDLGGERDGTGGDVTPAQQVVDEIVTMGGEAVVNGDDVSDFDGAGRLIAQAVETFGDLHAVINNAGILRDKSFLKVTAIADAFTMPNRFKKFRHHQGIKRLWLGESS